MPVPGSPSVMSFYLLHGEKGVVCSICLYLVFPVMSSYFLQGDKRGFHDMFVPGFPCVMSFY